MRDFGLSTGHWAIERDANVLGRLLTEVALTLSLRARWITVQIILCRNECLSCRGGASEGYDVLNLVSTAASLHLPDSRIHSSIDV